MLVVVAYFVRHLVKFHDILSMDCFLHFIHLPHLNWSHQSGALRGDLNMILSKKLSWAKIFEEHLEN